MVDPQKVRHLLALYRRYRGYLSDLAGRSDEERVLQILRGSLGDLDTFVASLQERFAREIN